MTQDASEVESRSSPTPPVKYNDGLSSDDDVPDLEDIPASTEEPLAQASPSVDTGGAVQHSMYLDDDLKTAESEDATSVDDQKTSGRAVVALTCNYHTVDDLPLFTGHNLVPFVWSFKSICRKHLLNRFAVVETLRLHLRSEMQYLVEKKVDGWSLSTLMANLNYAFLSANAEGAGDRVRPNIDSFQEIPGDVIRGHHLAAYWNRPPEYDACLKQIDNLDERLFIISRDREFSMESIRRFQGMYNNIQTCRQHIDVKYAYRKEKQPRTITLSDELEDIMKEPPKEEEPAKIPLSLGPDGQMVYDIGFRRQQRLKAMIERVEQLAIDTDALDRAILRRDQRIKRVADAYYELSIADEAAGSETPSPPTEEEEEVTTNSDEGVQTSTPGSEEELTDFVSREMAKAYFSATTVNMQVRRIVLKRRELAEHALQLIHAAAEDKRIHRQTEAQLRRSVLHDRPDMDKVPAQTCQHRHDLEMMNMMVPSMRPEELPAGERTPRQQKRIDRWVAKCATRREQRQKKTRPATAAKPQ